MTNPSMALRLAFFLLLLLLLLAGASASTALIDKSDVGWGLGGVLVAPKLRCDGSVGDCVGEDEEMSMSSETARRGLRRGGAHRYISYDALKKNKVPCSRRGRSYYNCMQQGKANPYNRGCTVITRCARDTG